MFIISPPSSCLEFPIEYALCSFNIDNIYPTDLATFLDQQVDPMEEDKVKTVKVSVPMSKQRRLQNGRSDGKRLKADHDIKGGDSFLFKRIL
ncbi:hypothetical protein K1719_007892 [Acacia pycnantha]|nr:hypothetical protein K1719_007892 [Acacia pycnantha]